MQPTSAQALTQLTDYRAKRRNPFDILAEQKNKLGVDSVTGRVNNLRTGIINTENLLEGVDDSVTGRTSGTLTTEGARSRIVNLERQPIAKTLQTQTQGLTAAEQNLRDLTEQATSGAQLAYQGESDQENFLQNLYNTVFQQEAAAEEKRRYEQDRLDKLAEADRQRKAQASFYSGMGGGGGTTADTTDPLRQIAYDDVRTRVGRDNDAALKSDYNATAVSAQYGNPKDKFKLEIYKQLRPDLFGSYTPPSAADWNAPAAPTKPAVKTQVADFVTKPGSGNLSTGNAKNNMKQWFGWLPWSGQESRLFK